MMIPILKDYYAPGYLPDPGPKSIAPYLPNVNLALRRKLIEDIGGYDEACVAGEDADLCIRAACAGWAQFFDPGARTYHEPRPTLPSLLRQWIWYGKGGSHFFFKQQTKRLEIYLNLDLAPKMHHYRRVLVTGFFPIPAMIFVSGFLVEHLILFLALLAIATGFAALARLLLTVALVLPLFLYRKSTLRRLSWKELRLYAGIAYLINWTCIVASLIAGLKKRRIFLYPGI
jgi:cellulose synthase/poly-beta-1,6-N-acetylglucosamine synthase-like glycosyltransferase